MTYNEALAWYHSFEKFGINPGLERVELLCSRLGNPQLDCDFVHVTGTNGKGTTCTEIAGILKASGKKVGLYTSPEVLDFRERMQINGEMISREALCELTEKLKASVVQLNSEGIFPTQFEVLTAAAFLWFSWEKCSIVVLETGLGGRFDATNIIKNPLVCAVTSVSLDHTAVLGDTYEKIAYEKSGIFKSGAEIISGFSQMEAVKNVLSQKAAKLDCDIEYRDENEIFKLVSQSIFGTTVIYKNTEIRIPFTGKHQLANAAIATGVCEKLIKNGYEISVENIKDGIEGSRIPARTEILCSAPLIILDGSHNDGSTKALANVLKEHLPEKRIIGVMGMMADKDCVGSFANLAPFLSKIIAVTPSNSRSMSAEDFARLASSFGVESVACPCPKNGIELALNEISGYDAAVVCGSLYLACDVREYLIARINEIYR